MWIDWQQRTRGAAFHCNRKNIRVLLYKQNATTLGAQNNIDLWSRRFYRSGVLSQVMWALCSGSPGWNQGSQRCRFISAPGSSSKLTGCGRFSGFLQLYDWCRYFLASCHPETTISIERLSAIPWHVPPQTAQSMAFWVLSIQQKLISLTCSISDLLRAHLIGWDPSLLINSTD